MVRYKKASYRVWSLDVLNDGTGYYVNNRCEVGRIDLTVECKTYNKGGLYEFSSYYPEDKWIIRALKKEGYLKRNIRHKSIEIDGEAELDLYIDYGHKGMPLFQLECTTPEVFAIVRKQ